MTFSKKAVSITVKRSAIFYERGSLAIRPSVVILNVVAPFFRQMGKDEDVIFAPSRVPRHSVQ